VHILIGLTIMIVGLADFNWLARWAGRGQRLRPNFFRMFVFSTVGFGTTMGGLYYAESDSLPRVLKAAVLTGVAFGSIMTVFVAVTLVLWRVFRPASYSFTRAWMDAYTRHGMPPMSGRVRGSRRRAAVTNQFRERWERQQLTPPDEFIEAHWAEIAAAEGDIGGDLGRASH
jgi:hypothetical protein